MSEPLSVLIVEDEPLIAMMLEDYLDTLGYRVAGTVDSIADALDQTNRGGFDAAILDVHLNGEVCWPIADSLSDKGVPFLLATGGHVEAPPARHAGAVALPKPFTMEGVKDALESIVTPR